MAIDVPTVLIVIAAVTLFVSLTLFRESQAQRAGAPELPWWAGAYLIFAIGGVITNMRGDGLDIIGVGLANALLVTGNLMVRHGIRLFCGKRLSPVWFIAGPSWLLAYAATPLLDDIAVRIMVISAFTTIIATANAVDLWAARRETRAARDMAALYLFHAVFFMARTAAATQMLTPGNMPAFSGLIFQIALFEVAVFSVIVGTYLLAMVRERAFLRIRTMSEIDFLTGVDNRRAFFTKAETILAAGRDGSPSPASMLVFDLDHFKQINDAHGHLFGDAVLLAFCRIAEEHLRASDVLGRLGGEEFAVLLPGLEEPAAVKRAETIRTAFEAAVHVVDNQTALATVSVGVATASAGISTPSTLYAAADRALYRAKQTGRNRVEADAISSPSKMPSPATTPGGRAIPAE